MRTRSIVLAARWPARPDTRGLLQQLRYGATAPAERPPRSTAPPARRRPSPPPTWDTSGPCSSTAPAGRCTCSRTTPARPARAPVTAPQRGRRYDHERCRPLATGATVARCSARPPATTARPRSPTTATRSTSYSGDSRGRRGERRRDRRHVVRGHREGHARPGGRRWLFLIDGRLRVAHLERRLRPRLARTDRPSRGSVPSHEEGSPRWRSAATRSSGPSTHHPRWSSRPGPIPSSSRSGSAPRRARCVTSSSTSGRADAGRA